MVVWSAEHFRNHVYGTNFQVISEHKALSNVLKGNRGTRTYSSRLTRWVDRLLAFHFEVIHAPARALGFADYLSRHSSPIYGESMNTEELWNSWFTANHVNAFNSILTNQLEESIRCKQREQACATAPSP